MAIYHDSYLFQPENFAADVVPCLEDLQRSPEGYVRLRSRTIAAYDESTVMRLMAEDYGGWDRKSIVGEVPADKPENPEDVAFWLVLLLYHHFLNTAAYHLGLRDGWRLMGEITGALGWSDVEADLLITGRSFRSLRDYMDHTSENLEYLEYLHPFSTGGRAGWLSFTDVQSLHGKLVGDQPRFENLQIGQDAASKKVYASAFEMLNAAEKERCGLCLIRSG